MSHRPVSKLNPRKKYLQVALNSTLEEAHRIIRQLPRSDRILLEVGTPLIKRYGEQGIRQIRNWYDAHLGQRGLIGALGLSSASSLETLDIPQLGEVNMRAVGESLTQLFKGKTAETDIPDAVLESEHIFPYIVADLKTMDRGETEVEIALRGGASAAIALGSAPIETLNSFIASCEARGLDAMIDMMNVEYPLSVLRQLKKIPPVVILHRGVDEEHFNKEKQIPLHEIRRIKGNYNIMISIAGGDTPREVQRAIFNDADIVVIWKSVFANTKQTVELVNEFLKAIK